MGGNTGVQRKADHPGLTGLLLVGKLGFPDELISRQPPAGKVHPARTVSKFRATRYPLVYFLTEGFAAVFLQGKAVNFIPAGDFQPVAAVVNGKIIGEGRFAPTGHPIIITYRDPGKIGIFFVRD